MTNPNRGEMLITLGEKTWNSRVTMDGLARIEAFCGYGIIKILGKLTEGDLTTTEICGIIHPQDFLLRMRPSGTLELCMLPTWAG